MSHVVQTDATKGSDTAKPVKINLTPEEEAEFTMINAVAFDLCRSIGERTGKIPPMWLCQSEESRDTFRNAAANAIGNMVRLVFDTPEDAQTFLEEDARMSGILRPRVELWRSMEATMKQLRVEGNPRAFFCEPV